jgi:hypothetical protein
MSRPLVDRVKRLDRLYLAADAAFIDWMNAPRREQDARYRHYLRCLRRYRDACAEPMKKTP